MGEKEIKPADPKPQDPKPQTQEWHTQERPGTGTQNPQPEKPQPRGGGGRPSSSGGSSSFSGHIEYEDGYRMGRDEDGTTWLQHPEGGRATWDAGAQTWTHNDTGKTMGSDWTAGHRPTDYGPKR